MSIDWKRMACHPSEKGSMVVYALRNQTNGKIYVGKTTRALYLRLRSHIYNVRFKNFFLYRALRKDGIEAFEYSILQVCADVAELSSAERWWIKEFNSTDDRYGYNLTHGGEGCSATEVTKEKIGKSNRGKIRSEEYRRGRRLALAGKRPVYTENAEAWENAKRKIAQKLVGNTNGAGKACSAEKREKIRKALMGRKRPKSVVDKVRRTLRAKRQAQQLTLEDN